MLPSRRESPSRKHSTCRTRPARCDLQAGGTLRATDAASAGIRTYMQRDSEEHLTKSVVIVIRPVDRSAHGHVVLVVVLARADLAGRIRVVERRRAVAWHELLAARANDGLVLASRVHKLEVTALCHLERVTDVLAAEVVGRVASRDALERDDARVALCVRMDNVSLTHIEAVTAASCLLTSYSSDLPQE